MPEEKMEISEFTTDNDIKHEFLEKQKKSTRKFYNYVLSQVDEFETEIQKSVYDFNIEDRDELLIVKFKNTTVWAFRSNLACLKKYVDFCIAKKLVRHNENRFATILPKDYINYVNAQAVENRYISKTEVRELQEKILNNQDKLILELLSWGVRGRTEKGNTLEELINLRVKDIKWETNTIYILNNDGEFRYLEVDDYTIELIRRTIQDDFYIFNNGFKKKKNEDGIYEETTKGFPINETDYVFRIPGRTKTGKVDHQFFARRIQHMRVWLEKPYLTISNLYFSAMIEFAKELKEKSGELTKLDCIKINERFQYGESGEKYWHKTQELMRMYV